jgi:hypothetical protein
MEIESVVLVLEKTILFLRQSDSSSYAHFSVEELIVQLEHELNQIKNFNLIDLDRLCCLFGPTSSLQDTAIDNGWGNEFLELAKDF